MKCSHCGEPLPEGAKFCTSCGAARDVTTGEPTSSHVPPPLPTESSNPDSAASTDHWGAFFQSLGSEHLDVTEISSTRFEFSGKSKIKTLLGRTTLRYKAVAVIDPATRKVQWWEKLSESSLGLAPGNAGVSAEVTRQKGISVQIEKSVQTPGGGYAYHYGDLRAVVKSEALSRGWELTICVSKP